MFFKNNKQLIIFFVLTFILAWGTWIPAFLIPNFPTLITFVGLFAPAISSLIVSGIFNGKKGILEILERYKRVNFKWKWYFIATLLLPIAYALSIILNISLFNYSTKDIFVASPIYFIIGSFIWLMIDNSGEEIGWRGFALPMMLKGSKKSFGASLLLGVVWGIWHLPMYLIPGQSSFPYPLFLILTIGLSFVYTGLFLKSKGSLIPAVLLHAGTDIGPRIFQTGNFTPNIWLTIDIIVIIAALYFILTEKSEDIKESI